MKTSTQRPARNSVATGWLPTAPARSLDLSHWQSRAARGFSWNAAAPTRRRRTH
jgi:hypothetical protein